MQTQDLQQRRKLIDASIESARKRLSLQTGYVHLCYENPFGDVHDTIPLLENFCFALSLCRSRLSDHVLEARALLDRLLCFEREGQFPIYLHQYPQIKDKQLSLHILPIFYYLLQDFSSVLGENLVEKIRSIMDRVIEHGKCLEKEGVLSHACLYKLQAAVGELDPNRMNPESLSSWAECMIALQMGGSSDEIELFMQKALSVYDTTLGLYIGLAKERSLDGFDVPVSLFDVFMCEYMGSYSTRVLRDSPYLIRTSLVHPFAFPPKISHKATSYRVLLDPLNKQKLTLFWGDKNLIHSLAVECKKGECRFLQTGDGLEITYVHDPIVPSEDDSIELSLYVDSQDGQEITVNDLKATVCKLDDTIKILSHQLEIEVLFSLMEGTGSFMGHIGKANRSSQLRKHGHEAYDWKIGLRTIDRSSYCVTRLSLGISAAGEKAGLSTATPIA